MRRSLFVILFTLLTIFANATRMSTKDGKVSLWKGTQEKHFARQTHLTPFIPEAINDDYKGTVVIVCPGGSYSWLDRKTEGEEVANWLKDNGIPSFILEYRTQGVLSYITHYRLFCRGKKYPDASRDLLKAMLYIEEHAEEYNIKAKKIGVMGFSAGGHLVMNSVCQNEGVKDIGSKTPDFIVPIYPVVTMNGKHVHKKSRRALLGEYGKHNKEFRNKLSLELNIPDDCPPVFLVNCKDDNIVDYRNSVLLDSALTSKNIFHKYLLYEEGGHGFGASDTKGSEDSRKWKFEFLDWLKQLCNL